MQLSSTQRRLDQQRCTAARALNAAYNGDNDVPPYVGLMFEIEAVNDIEILTFELDIRFDLNPIDLSIEVYTTEIAYDVVMNKPAEWDQLAGTYLVIPPGASSAIIPADDFSPVLIASGEKRSFYVTMKGPYLDHTVYALQQTGDVQMRGDDMQLLVGSGFTSYKFSGIVDSTLDPQFSGVIHYKKTFDCEDPKASTTVVVFSFIFESNELDSTFVEEISASIDHAVGNLLQSNNAMRKFVNENRLSKRKATVTQLHNFDYVCPREWVACPTVFSKTFVTFDHQYYLDSGTVLFEMYKLLSPIIDSVKSTMNREIMYIGLESADAEFAIVLTGVPAGMKMDEIQMKYFEDKTELYLTEAKDRTTVFKVQVNEQVLFRGNSTVRRYLEQEASLQLRGVIQGAIPTGQSSSSFSSTIDSFLQQQKSEYLSILIDGEIRPSDRQEGNRLAYFRNITEISVVVTTFSKSSDKTAISIALVTAVGAVLFTIIVLSAHFLLRRRKQAKTRSVELAQYRQEMRERRRIRRSRISSSESLDTTKRPTTNPTTKSPQQDTDTSERSLQKQESQDHCRSPSGSQKLVTACPPLSPVSPSDQRSKNKASDSKLLQASNTLERSLQKQESQDHRRSPSGSQKLATARPPLSPVSPSDQRPKNKASDSKLLQASNTSERSLQKQESQDHCRSPSGSQKLATARPPLSPVSPSDQRSKNKASDSKLLQASNTSEKISRAPFVDPSFSVQSTL